MTKLTISLLGNKTCSVSHNKSTSEIVTKSPLEFGGAGDEFSSTDLLAAALGTCIATSIDNILERNNIKFEDTKIIVLKNLSIRPKNISSLSVRIEIRGDVKAKTMDKILRAANTCLVHKSLNIEPEILIATK